MVKWMQDLQNLILHYSDMLEDFQALTVTSTIFIPKRRIFLKLDPTGAVSVRFNPEAKSRRTLFYLSNSSKPPDISRCAVVTMRYFMLQKVLILKQGHHPQTSKTV